MRGDVDGGRADVDYTRGVRPQAIRRIARNRPTPTSRRDTQSAVDDAFGFVVPSVEWALQRFAAIDTRIHRIIAVTATVTVAAPIAGKAVDPNICFGIWQFILGVVLGGLTLLAGAIAQTLGTVRVLRLRPIYDQHRHKPSPRFRHDVLRAASLNQDTNLRRLKIRAWVATGLSLGLATEVVLLVFWLAGV